VEFVAMEKANIVHARNAASLFSHVTTPVWGSVASPAHRVATSVFFTVDIASVAAPVERRASLAVCHATGHVSMKDVTLDVLSRVFVLVAIGHAKECCCVARDILALDSVETFVLPSVVCATSTNYNR
jgi:hypothetical protein